MVDQTANFVRGEADSSIGAGDTTISVVNASEFPDPANGQYNLVLWDDGLGRPDQDSDVEIVRVTGRDTTNDNLTVTRAQEGTSDVSHPSGSALQLSPTTKTIDDLATTIPTYEEDANSPFTATQTDSITCALADRYDEWLILMEWSNHDISSGTVFRMELNGNTGNNYLFTDSAGGVTSDADSIVVGQDTIVLNDSNPTRASYIVDGNWSGNGTCSLTAYNGSGAKQVGTARDPTMYAEGDVSSPLTEFRVFNDFSDKSDIKIVAAGRDTQ
jgi:hypothetical protein